MLYIKGFVVGPLENNTYWIIDEATRKAVVVDPSVDSALLLKDVEKEALDVAAIINTHGHFDHIYDNAAYKKALNCPLLIHKGDHEFLTNMQEHASLFGFVVSPSPQPDGFLADNQEIEIGENKIKILHTPGHSPGGICILGDDFVITGDTLFASSIGRTDLPGGDFTTLISSIQERLLVLPDNYRVYPGHGPSTTIGEERRSNPFLAEVRYAD